MLDGFRSGDELITFSNANYVCSVVRSKQQSIIWITLRKQASLCVRPMAVGIIPKGVLVVKKRLKNEQEGNCQNLSFVSIFQASQPPENKDHLPSNPSQYLSLGPSALFSSPNIE